MQEGFDAARLLERDLLGVAKGGVGFVLHRRLVCPLMVAANLPTQWIGVGASLVYLPDHGRRRLAALAALLQLLDLGGLVGAVGIRSLYAQGALDRDLPVAEGGVVEDLALLGLLEGEEGVTDADDVLLAQFAVLLAQVLAQRTGASRWRRSVAPCRGGARACGW